MMLIMPAFLTVNWPSGTVRSVAALFSASVILINAATVAVVWFSYRSDYAEIIASFQLLRRGSSILIGRGDGEAGRLNAPMFYAPTLAAHYATAFVPSLYTLSGAQPVRKALRNPIFKSKTRLTTYRQRFRS